MSDLFSRLQSMFGNQTPPDGAFTVNTYAEKTKQGRHSAKDQLDKAVSQGVLQCGTFRVPNASGHVRPITHYWETTNG